MMFQFSIDWAEPLLCFGGAQVLSIITLAYVPASSLFARQISLTLGGLLTLGGHVTLFQLSERGGIRCMIATFAWAQLLNSCDLLCISRYECNSIALKSSSPLKWASGMQWNLRRISTAQAIKQHVAFSKRDPTYIPSRAWFYLRASTQLLAWLLYMAFGALQPRPPVEQIAPDKQFLFHGWSRLNAQDFGTRVMFTVFWYIGITAVSQVCYNTCALLFVGAGLSDIGSWPPWFGYLSKAYSVRNFWGGTWHQTWRHLLTKNADLITYDVLHLPKSSILTRYTRITMTFLLSGLVHLASDLAIGVPLEESGAISYFVMQSIAIMIEDMVQEANRQSGIIKSELMKKALGFIWVALWFIIVTPQWNYPPARHMRPFKDDMIDFSLLKG